jgi:cysteinyl-tRNA synthetase
VLPAGTTITVTELQALTHGDRLTPIPRQPPRASPETAPPTPTLTELATDCERRFIEARTARDAEAMAEAILTLETAIREWAADTEEDDGTDQARAILRTLIVRLSQSAAPGLTDPTHLWKPLIPPLLALREDLRTRHDYKTADALRNALTAAGIHLQDSTEGVEWSLSNS